MVKILSLIFISVLTFCVELSAQDVSVLASVDSSDYLVGDYITYTFEIRSEKNIDVLTPLIRDSLKKVEVIKETEPVIKEEDKIKSVTYVFVISYYDSASVTIPPIAVRYKITGDSEEQVALSNPVTFTIHTLPVEQQADIKDVKEPLTIPLDWKFILLIGIIVLVVLAVVYYFYRKYKKKKAEQPIIKRVIKIPAHIKALNALDNLESRKLWQKGDVKEYHSRITEIIRNYFLERFNLPALELTTTEQIHNLKRVPSAQIILNETEEFLNNADLVKFAKFIPLPSINEEMMRQAREIVTKTIPKETENVQEVMQHA